MKKELKRKLLCNGVYFLAIIFMILSIIYIVKFFLLKKEAIEERNLLNTIEENEKIEINNWVEADTTMEEEKEVTNQVTERMQQVKSLKMENEDIVGWLEIENTKINYPVLQGTDDEYYLTHNYKKEKTQKGSIFLSKDYNWEEKSSNLQIYGHNMDNGEMFHELLKYENKKFYEQHPTIRFTTEEEDAIYEIISVFKSRVYYQSEKNVFRYYYFINAETEEEYNAFVKNAKKVSLHEIKATAKYGDQLMTLSTCSYHTEDGRFVVVARKINEND